MDFVALPGQSKALLWQKAIKADNHICKTAGSEKGLRKKYQEK